MTARNEFSPLWTSICIFMFFWLCHDLYYSIVDGATLRIMRFGHLFYSDSPVFFLVTILIKLLVLLYIVFYLYRFLVSWMAKRKQIVSAKLPRRRD